MSQQPRNPQRNNSHPQARQVPNHAQIRAQQQNLIANRARQQRLILEYLRSTEIGLLTLEENIGKQHKTQGNVLLNGSGLINQAAIVAIQTSAAIFANRNRINNTIAVQETVTLLNNLYRNNTGIQLQKTLRGRSRKRNPNKKYKKKLIAKIPKQLKESITPENAKFNYQWNFIPRLGNILRKYIKPTEEILMQRPIEEVQLDIEVTIKELISRCSPTSNHRLGQTLVVLQQALEVNGLIPNDTAIFVHEQQQRQTEYINLLTATNQQIGAIKWKLIRATEERLIPYFITQIIVHGANSLQGILTNEGANFVQGRDIINSEDEELHFNEHLRNSNITVFSTDIPPHEITTSLFTTQAEKALHPYSLLKEEIKEEAYYCVTISDKDPLQIIAHQGTPGININIYKDTNNQPFIGKYYYVIVLFDNLLEDEIFIKIDIWHEYIYIKGKVQPIIA
ncbi:hypothetical protein C2G38_2230191 [Gigaspora rosea]|uniref:Uncharacterized protein n=1 Tax=Gigaspora rosea TaxID=44941 RepID=A0A397TU40_9GLOM|nr:hypothetical protein C2G38_2230191 [Gigaspora rosea]